MVEDFGLLQRQDWKQSNFGFGIYKGGIVMKLWIARDPKGSRLTLHGEEPVWNEEYMVWARWYITDLDHDLLPEVTFENSPQEVELVIKK